jgi:hypothetical protein
MRACKLESYKMTRSPALSLVPLVALLATTLASPALGDWPNAAHDPARTALATGKTSITKPIPYWRYYLGGTLSGTTHYAADVNGDGIVEVVYLAGGKVIAKLPDDRLVWETSPVDAADIAGVADVDGDKLPDVVATEANRVVAVSGADGHVIWEEPAGEIGTIGGARVGDLDGDGLADVLVDDCACCGVENGSLAGVAYSIAGGNAKKLWSPATRPGHCGSSGVTLGDWDADGVLDVAYNGPSGVELVSGKTGQTLDTSTATLGNLVDRASCTSANVDGRPGDELVCYDDTYYAAIGQGNHSAFVVTYDATAVPKAKILWQLASSDVAGGRLVSNGRSLSDLDKDGKLEVTVGFYDQGAWTTQVLDAATGANLATLPGQVLQEVVDVQGNGTLTLVTAPAAGGALEASSFARAAMPPTAQLWTLSGATILEQVDWTQHPHGTSFWEAVTLDVDGDGTGDLLAQTTDNVVAYHAKGAQPPTSFATYAIPSGVTLLTSQPFTNLTLPFAQLTLTRNDGFFLVLDRSLAVTNSFTGMNEFTSRPGMRVGGYRRSPIATNVGAGGDSVVATDSRGAVIRLDGAGAWMESPPPVAWELRGASDPSTFPKLTAGGTGFVCARGSAYTAVDAAGKTLWSQSLAGSSFADALPSDVNGDGVPDALVTSIATGSIAGYQALSGTTGAPLWGAPPSISLQWGLFAAASADMNGDGVPDLIALPNTLRIHDGKTGSVLVENPNFLAYATPTIEDVDFDGVTDVTLSRMYYGARTYQADLATALWTGPDADRPYQHGAAVACAGQVSVWTQPSQANPGQVSFETMNGASAGQATVVFVAGGQLYSTAQAAQAAGQRLGAISDVAAKQDLLGTGDHASALVGSTDGWLYALNPCKGTLDWAYQAGFAVGDVIFADTSGDGADEILLSSSDGYLYALSQQVLDAPAWVYDTDPEHGITTMDVDMISTHDTLSGAWAAVAGADAYEVSIVTAGGSYVTDPDWEPVANVTSASIHQLPLVDGKKYFFRVRAVSKTKGSSPFTSSNGVVVHLTNGSFGNDGGTGDDGGMLDGGDDGGNGAFGQGTKSGCGCVAAPSEAAGFGPVVLGLLGSAALLRLRRGRPSRCTERSRGRRPRRSGGEERASEPG